MLRVVLAGLIGAASLAVAYVALTPSAPETARPEASPPFDAAQSRTERLRAALRDPQDGAMPPAAPAEAIRDVTPSGVTSRRPTGAPLVRLPIPASPPNEARKETARLFKPVVIAAGVIKAKGRDIRLLGVDAPGFEARCGEDEAAWPCGRMARAALRRLIRGRAIECDLPPGADDVPEESVCRVAGVDLGQWLVEQGWARRDGDRYSQAEEDAREAKLGIWGGGRPSGQADDAAATASPRESAEAISDRVSGTP